MNASGPTTPAPRHVQDQLERILLSDVFRANEKPAGLFRFIVENHLRQKRIMEPDIRAALFPTPPYDPGSTIVRTTKNKLVDLLDGYYLKPGKADHVILSLPRRDIPGARMPKGEAYKVIAHYANNEEANKQCKLGDYFLATSLYSKLQSALDHYAEATEYDRNNVQAYLGMAETLAWMVLYTGKSHPGYEQAFKVASDLCVNCALPRAPQLWRAHAVYGVVLTVYGEIDKATECFDRALERNPGATCEYDGYHYFLTQTNKIAQARELTASVAISRPQDVRAQLNHAGALMLEKQLLEAQSILERVLAMDRNSPMAHIEKIACLIMSEKRDEALAYRERIREVLDPVDLQFFLSRFGLPPLS